jgi:Ca2+-binding RTX toxin-like protein
MTRWLRHTTRAGLAAAAARAEAVAVAGAGAAAAAAAAAAIVLLALPAGAAAAVAPPYDITTPGGELHAKPSLGSSTLAVRIARVGTNLEFTPAAASAPGCTTTPAVVTKCPVGPVLSALELQGDVLDVDVDLHDMTTTALRLIGGAGNDSMIVTGPAVPGLNKITNVLLTTGTGNDAVTISGNVGNVTPTAPDPGGDDRYVINSDNPTINGTLLLGDGNDVASSNADNLKLDGGLGDDTLSGAGDLLGGPGSDVLEPTKLGKAADGGAGDIDTLSYDLFTTGLGLSMPGLPSPGDVVVDTDPKTKTGIEQLRGSPFGDRFTGTAAQDVFYGGDGDDVVDGRGGGDVLDGGPGPDTVTYEFAPGPVTVDLAAGTAGPAPLDSLTSFRRVVTGAGNDVVTGTSADEVFTLGPGDDTVNAGAGNDTVDAGAGNDYLRGGLGADTLDGGPGSDTSSYDDRGPSEPLDVTLATLGGDGAAGENDTLPGIENVIGGASNDVLTGDGQPNLLIGGPGLNTMDGLAGDDEIHGGDNRDVITGGPGNDRLFGAGDDDSINAFDTSVPDADVVSCGASADDDAQVDATDVVTECEYARRADVPLPVDEDHDGFVGGFDCDDHNPARNQGETDIPGDGIDQNCDGFDQEVPYVDYGLAGTIDKTPKGIKFVNFAVTRLFADRRVDVTCKSRPGKSKVGRCPFKTATKRPKAGSTKVLLSTLFKGRRLAPGAIVELRITAPKFNGRVRRFTSRPNAFRSEELCLTRPSTKPRKCPEGDEL